MLTTITNYIQAKLSALNYLQQVYGMAAIVDSHDETFPAVYEKDELILINFDDYKSLTYLLPDGKVNRETEEHPFIGCVNRITETYPLQLIFYAQSKEAANCDSLSKNIVWNISKALTGRQKAFEQLIGFDTVFFQIKSITVDKAEVWKSQFSILNKLKDNDMLLAMELEVLIQGEEACFVGDICPSIDEICSACGIITEDSNCIITENGLEIIVQENCADNTAPASKTVEFNTTADQSEYIFDGTITSYNPEGLDLRAWRSQDLFSDGLRKRRYVHYEWYSNTGKLFIKGTVYDGVPIDLKLVK